MPPRIVDGPDAVRGVVGEPLGPTAWLTVDQARIDRFAEATGDHQWIHVDRERARQESPFGTTIAHGYLTLSLVSHFLPQLLEFRGFAMGVNYGCNKVRFPAPVPEGARIRATATIVEATDVAGGVQLVTEVVIEVEGGGKPACVAEIVSRFLS